MERKTRNSNEREEKGTRKKENEKESWDKIKRTERKDRRAGDRGGEGRGKPKTEKQRTEQNGLGTNINAIQLFLLKVTFASVKILPKILIIDTDAFCLCLYISLVYVCTILTTSTFNRYLSHVYFKIMCWTPDADKLQGT